MSLHTITDRLSPAHAGEQLWIGSESLLLEIVNVRTPGLFAFQALAHHATESPISRAEFIKAVEEARRHYLRVFGDKKFLSNGVQPGGDLSHPGGGFPVVPPKGGIMKAGRIPAMLRGLGPRGWAILVVLSIAGLPVRRVALVEWTVTVLDTRGDGVMDLVVAQSWSDYSFNERGSR